MTSSDNMSHVYGSPRYATITVNEHGKAKIMWLMVLIIGSVIIWNISKRVLPRVGSGGMWVSTRGPLNTRLIMSFNQWLFSLVWAAFFLSMIFWGFAIVIYGV